MKTTDLSRTKSSPDDAPIDATRCPLCGRSNHCVMANASADQDQCWCVSADFSPALLERVPTWARNKVCICAQCAAAQSGHQATC